jgi:pyrimidine operon attenuation protein/uracil phosphoribosyltransferase
MPAPGPAAEPGADRSAVRPVTGDRAAARPVLEAPDLARALTRIAHEILERNRGAADVVLLGIPTRGVTLARRLGKRIAEVEGLDEVPVGSLDVTLYRDDLRLRGVRALAETELPPGGIDDKVVVLVDDVLFSGRTVRAALDALANLGRPSAVQLAVLVDRGHRELPIRADYVGKNIPTSLSETVHVLLEHDDGRDAVLLGPADGAGNRTSPADGAGNRTSPADTVREETP